MSLGLTPCHSSSHWRAPHTEILTFQEMDPWAKEEEWLARGSASDEANASASGSASASAEGQGEGREGRREGQRGEEGEGEGYRTSQDSSPEGEGEGEGEDEGSLEAEVSSLPRLRENVDVPFGLFSCPPRSGRRFKGVRRRKWGRCVCEIRDAIGKRIWLGSYDTEEEAARVYDAAARILQGESAWLNFPKEDPVSLPRGVVRTLIKHRGHLTDRLRGDAFPPPSTPRGTTAGSTSPPSRQGPPGMHPGRPDQAGAGAGERAQAGAGAGVAAGAELKVQIGAGPASGGFEEEGPSSLRALHSSQGQASQVGAAGAGAGDPGAPGDSQEGKIDWHMFLEALDDDLAALGDTLGAPRAVKQEPASPLGQVSEPAQAHRTQPQQRQQEQRQQQAPATEGAGASFQDAAMMHVGSELTDFQRASDLASLAAANAGVFQLGTAQVGGPAVHRQQAPLAPLLPSTASSASHSPLPALPSLTHSSLPLSQATLTQSPLLTHSSLTSSPLMAQQPLTQPPQPSLTHTSFTHTPFSHSPFPQSPIAQTPLTLPGSESLTSRASALPFDASQRRQRGAPEAPPRGPTQPLQAFLRQLASPLPSPSNSSAPAPGPAPAPAAFPAQYPGPIQPPALPPGPVVFPRGVPGRDPQAGPAPGEVRALSSLLRSLEASASRSLAATPSLQPPPALQSPAYPGDPQGDHSMQEAGHPSLQAPQQMPGPLRHPPAVDPVEEELAQIEFALAVLSGRRAPVPSAPHSFASAQGTRAAVSDGPGLPLPLPQHLQRGAVHADGAQGMRPGQAQVCPLGEVVGSAILFPDQTPPASTRQGPLAPGLAPRASLPLQPNSEGEAQGHVLAKRLSLPERGGQRALLSATWPPLAGCRLPSNSQP